MRARRVEYYGRKSFCFTKILPYEYGVAYPHAPLGRTRPTFAARWDRRALPRRDRRPTGVDQLTALSIPTGLSPSAQQRCWIVNGIHGILRILELGVRLCCLEGFELMIHIDQQSTHDRGECDFGRFLFGTQALVERLQHGITAGRTQGAMYKAKADFGTTATIQRIPFIVRFGRVQGAKPAKAATCWRLIWPNSGICARTSQAGARTDALDVIQTIDALLQLGILCEQGSDLFFHRHNLRLVVGHELGVAPADKGRLVMFGLRFGQGLCLDQLHKPLSQRHQLVLAGGGRRGGFKADNAGRNRQQGRINTVGFWLVGLAPGRPRALVRGW